MKSILTSLFSLVLCATLHAQLPSYVPADGLVGWWPFNGNANDESGNGYDGSVAGATLSTNRFGNINSSYEFLGQTQPGTDNTAIITDNVIDVFGFNPQLSDQISIALWSNTYDSNIGGFLQRRVDNNIDFACGAEGVHMGSVGICSSSNVTSNNEWHHHVYNYDGTKIRHYIDGLLVLTTSGFGNISNNTLTMNFGKYIYHGGLTHFFYFNGKLDDIAIYNRALTPAEITQLYTGAEEPVATCTPPAPNLQNGLVGYWPFCGNANDESGNGNNGVVNGATLAEDRFGNANAAYDFTPSESYISTSFAGETGDRSISLWFQKSISNETNNQWTLATYGGGQEGTVFGLFIFPTNISNQGNKVGIDVGNSYAVYNPLPALNQWHHLVGIYSNSPGSTVTDCMLYLDGIFLTDVAGQQNPSVQINTGTGAPNLTFGGNSNYPLTGFEGTLDDIAIYNRALSQEEITQLFTGLAAPCNLIASETQDTPVEVGGSAQMYVTLNATDYSMQWQTNAAGLGWMDVQDNNTYTGSQTQNLLISNATLANHEQPFRIIVTDGICNDTSDVALLMVNNTCTAYDTITTTVEVFDTLTIENVVEVYDTLTIYNTIDIFDTTSVTVEVFDTITNVIDVFDTTTIYLQVDIFDTLFIDVYDTTYVQQTINVYDTTYVTLTDTTYIQVIDTAYVTVTDTLLIDITFIGFEGQPSWLNTVLVYPNPTSDHITIDYGNFALMAGYNTIITDAAGATVYSSAVNTQQATIDINAWGAAGIYYMSIYDVNGAVVAVRQIVLE